MHIILIILALFAVAFVIKAVYKNSKVDAFAKDFCTLNEKSAEKLCKDGEEVFEALDEKVDTNLEKQTKLEKENEQIKEFSNKIVSKAIVEKELSTMEKQVNSEEVNTTKKQGK